MSPALDGQLSFWEAPRQGRTGEDLRRELLASFSGSDREGAARDQGIDLAAAAQELSAPGWHDRADAALRRLAERSLRVDIDLLYVEMGLLLPGGVLNPNGDWPSHPNAWASVWKRAKTAGVISRLPQGYYPTSLPGKHHHVSPYYHSRIQRRSA
jgi:hypothetical protein